MGLMDEAMRADSQFTSDTDAFGETVVLRAADGTEYTRVVIVDRNAPVRDPEYARNVRIFDVQIARDDTGTAGLATPPTQGWSIKVKNDPSDYALPSTFSREFIGIVTADSGGWLVQFG